MVIFMDIQNISYDIYKSYFKGLSEEEFNNINIDEKIDKFFNQFKNEIKQNIINSYKFDVSDHKLFKIINFCKKFDLDDRDILNQIITGVENAWDNLENDDLYVEEPNDPGWFYKIDLNDILDDYSIESLVWVVKEYNLDMDCIMDNIALDDQVQSAIDSYNHARLYYDNQLYYDEKIEAIEEAYDELR